MGEDLVSYVRSALEKGYSEDAIKKRLVESGWSEKKVKRAIRKAKGGGNLVVVAVLGILLVFILGGGIFVLFAGENDADEDTGYSPEELSSQNDSVDSDEYPCSDLETVRRQQIQCFRDLIEDAENRYEICDQVPLEKENSLKMCRTAYTRVLQDQNSDNPV